MRFDLEIDIVGELSQEGLDKAATLLYSDDEEILPMIWDTKVIPFNDNIGKTNYNNFNAMSNVSDSYVISGKTDTSSLGVYNILDRDGRKYLLLSGGDLYSHKDLGSISNNTITSQIQFTNGYYLFLLDNDYDIDSINISTFSFISPGYFKKKKNFTYTKYDNISLVSTFESVPKDYQYTIIDNLLYLNINKIEFIDKKIGIVKEGNKIFALPEFPVKNLSVRNMTSNEYSFYNGLIILKNKTSASREISLGEDIVVTYELSPMISFKQKERSILRSDIILEKLSIDPKSLNFNNGVICLNQNFNSYEVPYKLTTKVLNTGTIRLSDNINIESKLLGLSDIPISGKQIDIDILSNNAKWQNGESKYSSITGIDGTIKSSLVNNNSKLGTYIQRQWMRNVDIDGVVRGQLVLPFVLQYADPSFEYELDQLLNGLYLYSIQNDDPILGKINAGSQEEGIDEFYNGSSLADYVINGRKVAYIKLVNSSNKIYSTYIKPINLEIKDNISVEFKNLFIKNNGIPIEFMSNKFSGPDVATVISYTSEELAGKYKLGILPDNILTIMSDLFTSVTVITYEDPFPLSNLDMTGAWLVSDEFITLTSSFKDPIYDISIVSEPITIKVKSIESELPFVVTGYSIDGYDTKTSGFGYLTATEYTKNPFGVRACSYYCVFSDAINKKCTHPNLGYRKYFILDNELIGCKHTPEYDATIDENLRCAGVNAHIVNPFTLQVQ